MNAAETTLVIGADGMIGRALAARLAADGCNVVCTVRTRGICRPEQAQRSSGEGPSSDELPELHCACSGLRVLKLDLARDAATWTPPPARVAFLCAATTSQAECRNGPAASRVVNVDATLVLAEKLLRQGTHVVFLSTNLVLSGLCARQAANGPYAPQTEYARQKAQVEQCLRRLPGTCVVRFTKVLGRGTPLLCDWCDALRKGQPIHPFADMPMAPVPIDFAVAALAAVASARAKGVVQVSASEDVTYAQAARYVAVQIGASAELVQPIAAAESGIAIEHVPRHTTLDATRLQREFGLAPPSPWDAIELGMK